MELSKEQIDEDLKEIMGAAETAPRDPTKYIPLEIPVKTKGCNVTVDGIKYTVGQAVRCSYHQYCSFQGVIDSVDPHKVVLRLPSKCENIPLILLRRGIVRFSETKIDCH